MSIEDKVNQRIKCRAYKNEDSPDDRRSLCGEPVQRDDDGRQFFEIPGHQRDYITKLLPSYTVTESFDVSEGPVAPKRGRKPRE